jgi:hypothetical protein
MKCTTHRAHDTITYVRQRVLIRAQQLPGFPIQLPTLILARLHSAHHMHALTPHRCTGATACQRRHCQSTAKQPSPEPRAQSPEHLEWAYRIVNLRDYLPFCRWPHRSPTLPQRPQSLARRRALGSSLPPPPRRSYSPKRRPCLLPAESMVNLANP